MITKTGTNYLVWPGMAAVGALRTAALSGEDKAKLKEEYGVSNLGLRNAGRAVAGGFATGVGSSFAGAVLASALKKDPMTVYRAAQAGAWGGFGLGAGVASNKYSRKNPVLKEE